MPSKLRRAIDVVKDQTSIGLAKVSTSTSLSDLDVAIVKATSHEEYPPEERHIREILSLTCYSRNYVGACVSTLARRLNKTRNWIVALKALMVIQRLLAEGDPAYEQEIFFSTRRGTRLLNLSDFRDHSRSNSWDHSAFLRTYALYLDEKLEYRMQGKRRKKNLCAYSYDRCLEEDEEEEEDDGRCIGKTPLREMKLSQLTSKMMHLQQLLERFLAIKPTGSAKHNRVILVALYPAVKESFHIYYGITELLSIFIDKFMEIDIIDCVKVHEIFCRASKQFDELDSFYSWCKDVGMARSFEYPEVERITPKKLDLMEEFIKDKSTCIQNRRLALEEPANDLKVEEEAETADPNEVKALPPPEASSETETQEVVQDLLILDDEEKPQQQQEADLLNLGEDAMTSEDHGDKLALALFDGELPEQALPPGVSVWEAFKDADSDWETALVQSMSYLPHQRTNLGGGFDMMLLDGLYHQGASSINITSSTPGLTYASGSLSSVAYGSAGNPQAEMLALPAPPSAATHDSNDNNSRNTMLALPAPPSTASSSRNTMSFMQIDPFSASMGVPSPPYVQMWELEKKQRLLTDEQMMWQQYAGNGVQQQQQQQQQSHYGYSNYQLRPPYNMQGGYNNPPGYNPYGYGYGY